MILNLICRVFFNDICKLPSREFLPYKNNYNDHLISDYWEFKGHGVLPLQNEPSSIGMKLRLVSKNNHLFHKDGCDLSVQKLSSRWLPASLRQVCKFFIGIEFVVWMFADLLGKLSSSTFGYQMCSSYIYSSINCLWVQRLIFFFFAQLGEA